MPDENEQEALTKIKAYLDSGHDLDAIREAGWSAWIDHLEARGYDLRMGQLVIQPPEDVPPTATQPPAEDVSPTEVEVRRVRFPDDRSLGRLFQRGREAGEWQEVGEAQGVVTIPRDAGLRLMMWSPRIGDAQLAQVRGLTGLQELGLASTEVTDAGLAHLSGLTGLQILSLDGTQITDAGLAHLAGLSGLQILDLASTEITDAGLAHLSRLAGLRELWLNSTAARQGQITDAGLGHLRGLTKLQFLTLDWTRITSAGLASLRRDLPDCDIEGYVDAPAGQGRTSEPGA